MNHFSIKILNVVVDLELRLVSDEQHTMVTQNPSYCPTAAICFFGPHFFCIIVSRGLRLQFKTN